MNTTLSAYLILSGLLFCIGLGGVLFRRNVIVMLIGVELMLAAANVNFLAFWRYGGEMNAMRGYLFVLFAIAVAAAEAAVGFALVVAFYRRFRTTELDKAAELKG